MVKSEIEQRSMVIPVVAVIQRNCNQLLSVSGSGADQTPQRLFGIACLHTIRTFVQAQHFIFVSPFIVPFLIRIVGCLLLSLHNLLKYRIMQRVCGQHGQIVGAGIMSFSIQPVRIGKMRTGKSKLLGFGIHQIDESLFRSADMFCNRSCRIIP
ncbi:hypothetical protein D3C81_1437670 [compost metagenome]